ncbi:MAG: nucleotide exchange factor GrpE [Candidatus Kariarchaeaceae archaeon]
MVSENNSKQDSKKTDDILQEGNGDSLEQPVEKILKDTPQESKDSQEREESNKKNKMDNEEEKKEEPVEMVEIPKKRLEELETVEVRALEEVKRERATGINYRKRLEKQRDEFAEIASVRVLKKLLNVKDDIQRILDNGKGAIPKEHMEGIVLLSQRVEGIFNEEEVSLIKIKEGKTAYDAYKHEAIMATHIEGMAPNIILTQVNAGFQKGDRVLRAAKVIISTRPPKPKEESKEDKKAEKDKKSGKTESTDKSAEKTEEKSTTQANTSEKSTDDKQEIKENN